MMIDFEMRWLKRPEGVKVVMSNRSSVEHFQTVLQYRVNGGEWIDVPTIKEENDE